MNSILKPYPDYQESGLLWLGAIPRNWSVRRLKWLVRNVAEQTDTKRADEIYVALDQVESWTGRILPPHDNDGFTSLVKRFEPNDLLFGKLRPYLAKVARPSRRGVCVGEFLVLRRASEAMSAEFLELLMRSFPFVHEVNSYTSGAKMPRVEWTRLGGIEIPCPTVQEQVDIVRFLSNAGARNSRLVRAKIRLIELLNDQRQTIIGMVVTRGLDSSAQVKPSGVRWLGDVPEHWDVCRAKYLFREVDERSNSGEEELLSVSHITGVTPRSQKSVTMFMASSYVGHKVCRAGDLVINTMWAWMGALGVSKQTGIVSPSYAVYRSIRTDVALPEFMDHLLRTQPYVAEYACRSTGIRSSRLRLYPERFLEIPIVVPSLQEQRELVATIDRATLQINQAIESVRRQIDLLREYHNRLVADVVTGQLDVRGLEVFGIEAANIPKEAETPEDILGDETIDAAGTPDADD